MWRAPKYSQSEFFFHNCNSNKEIERFSYDLENAFGKCSFFVVSKDQNMASSFPRQRKPYYGEGIVLLANRVAQYDFKAKYRLISRKFAGMKFFHPRVRLTNQKRKTKYDQFLVILDNTRVRKSKPNFLGQNPFPSYPSDRHTLTNYIWGMHSSQVFIQFILKVNICAKKLYAIIALLRWQALS